MLDMCCMCVSHDLCSRCLRGLQQDCVLEVCHRCITCALHVHYRCTAYIALYVTCLSHMSYRCATGVLRVCHKCVEIVSQV